MYIGTIKLRAPTESPSTQRPIMTWYQWCLGADIWTMFPTWKTIHQAKMDHRLPMRSATGPAINAPINVPMESWFVISPYPGVRTRKASYHGDDQANADIAELYQSSSAAVQDAEIEVK